MSFSIVWTDPPVFFAKSELSAYYKFGNHKESGTPLESIWFLGKAYYENKQYDKAIALFQEYKDTLRTGNKKDRMIVEEDIRLSQIAKKNTKSSWCILFHLEVVHKLRRKVAFVKAFIFHQLLMKWNGCANSFSFDYILAQCPFHLCYRFISGLSNCD